MHDRGHGHVDDEEETCRAEAEADQEEEPTRGFRERRHQAPEERVGRHPDEFHRLPELDPEFGSGRQFRESVGEEGNADQDAQDEKAGVAVFAE